MDKDEIENHIPAKMKRYIAEHNINFYTINAVKIAQEIGLGGRINMIMQAAFFKLANIIPLEDAIKYLKDAVVESYGMKGEKIVNMNFAAIDKGVEAIEKVDVPESWKEAVDGEVEEKEVPAFIKDILEPMNAQEGDKLPVSALLDHVDNLPIRYCSL